MFFISFGEGIIVRGIIVEGVFFWGFLVRSFYEFRRREILRYFFVF